MSPVVGGLEAMEREVIVVGAGPSGATAAMALAQKGRDVLLIDRKSFPRDKPCGDGVPAGAIEILYRHGMRERILDAGFYEVTSLRLVSPKGYYFDADFTHNPSGAASYVVPRTEFDATIQEHAVASGAEFCQAQVSEPIIEDGTVKGVRARVNGAIREIRARVVIGADGVTSAITRTLRQVKHVDLHRAVALRVYVEDIQEMPRRVEFFLYRDILPGYAWIFPIGEGRVNLGLGMRLDVFRTRKQDLDRMLDAFLELPPIKRRLKNGGKLRDKATWQLNFGSQRDLQHAYDGALLIGDAAGFINPLTGGGIYNGMVSAELAAQVVDEALRLGDVSRQALLGYERMIKTALWSGMRRSYFIQRWLLAFPSLVDVIIRRMTVNSEFAKTFMSKL
jgi:geranylgeranyl reductase family protein